jgi:pimeloyl-ACP methyl ester carboxylesterase
VLDALGGDEFVTVGHSGGGPHAIACAALLRDRCRAAATIGGVAPAGAFGPGWTDGMAAENVEEFAAAAAGEPLLRPYLESGLAAYAAVDAGGVVEAFGGLVTDVDRHALTEDYADMVARCLRRAAHDGIDGWVDDDLAFLAPWGFDLGAVGRPVALWQGRHDAMVPFAHGEWLAAHVDSAHPRLLDDEGHLSLVNGRLEDVVDDLLELAGLES